MAYHCTYLFSNNSSESDVWCVMQHGGGAYCGVVSDLEQHTVIFSTHVCTLHEGEQTDERKKEWQ